MRRGAFGRLVLAAVTSSHLLFSCGAPPPGASLGAPASAVFPEDDRPLPRYHSKRFALSLPLPGASWRIDDHSQPELVATHAPTHSRVTIRLFRTANLAGRTECEAIARDHKLVPEGDLRTVEDEVTITEGSFDTRVWVAIEAAPGAPVMGHVMAFGGFLRKCYFFRFSSQVPDARDEAELSSRLAYARARIFGGLQLHSFGELSREPSALPELVPR